jgi:Family of unknown function (DUF6599)
MRFLLYIALCVTALTLACGGGPPETSVSEGSDIGGLLPSSPTLENWIVAEGPSEYSPDGLWEYLNGGAPLYLGYGFRRLAHVRYQPSGEDLAGITLDVFDMGSELGAFGIYSSGRPPGAELRHWGAEGYRSGTVTAAWKGSYFVHAEADDDRLVLTEVLESLVGETCRGIEGGTSPPDILDPLPTEGLVPHSERYIAEDLLGHSFLPGGLLATYEIDGREAQLFFSELGSADAAAEAMIDLREHRAKWGKIASDIPSIGAEGFRFSGPRPGSGTVVRLDRFIAGVNGELSLEDQDGLLDQLANGLF